MPADICFWFVDTCACKRRFSTFERLCSGRGLWTVDAWFLSYDIIHLFTLRAIVVGAEASMNTRCGMEEGAAITHAGVAKNNCWRLRFQSCLLLSCLLPLIQCEKYKYFCWCSKIHFFSRLEIRRGVNDRTQINWNIYECGARCANEPTQLVYSCHTAKTVFFSAFVLWKFETPQEKRNAKPQQ